MFLHAFVLATASNSLVDAFLSRISDYGFPQRQQRTITVGALPPGWNSPVPLPQGVTIVGSVLTPNVSTEIFYEPADAKNLVQAYLSQLRAAGFSNKWGLLGHSGFAFRPGGPDVSAMCRGSQGVSITQAASDDLRVTITNGATGPCALHPVRAISPLPDLIPPPDSQIVGGTGGGSTSFGQNGMSSISSSAQIASPKPLADLFTSFASQMRAAQWRPDRAFVTPQGGVQSFHYRSGPSEWRATLIIVPGAKAHQYDARMEANGGPPQLEAQTAAISPLRPAPHLRRSDIPGALQLVESIASQYSSNGTRAAVYVGSAPPEWDKRLPLPAARPVGSVRGVQTTVYYEATRAQYDAYLARLQSAGWTAMHAGMPHIGGFATNFGNISTFCKAGLPVLSLSVQPNTNDVVISPGNVVSTCAAAEPPFEPPGVSAPLPQLQAPPNTSMRPGSAGIFNGTSGASITTTRSLSDVLADFAAQLQAAKWTAQTPLLSSTLGSQTFSYTDAQGARWQSVLTIYRSQTDPTTYYAFIDVTRLP